MVTHFDSQEKTHRSKGFRLELVGVITVAQAGDNKSLGADKDNFFDFGKRW